MTNAEKYLKDGVNGIRPLLDKCREIGAIDSGREYRIDQMLREQAKPTLTEDERVILKNIQLYTGKTVTIRRAGDGHLYISGGCGLIDFGQYNHLFQFIKERRRIFNKRIVERRIKMSEDLEKLIKIKGIINTAKYHLCVYTDLQDVKEWKLYQKFADYNEYMSRDNHAILESNNDTIDELCKYLESHNGIRTNCY